MFKKEKNSSFAITKVSVFLIAYMLYIYRLSELANLVAVVNW